MLRRMQLGQRRGRGFVGWESIPQASEAPMFFAQVRHRMGGCCG
jgi:hypothetical protein